MSGLHRVPTYIINLKKRLERKVHILEQFSGRDEFDINIVEAIEHPIGAKGLWQTLRYILLNLVDEQEEFILVCEDDHQFTDDYAASFLFSCIERAKEKDGDILTGGVSGFINALEVSENLWWIERFSGLQFTIIFRKIFNTILEADFGDKDAADYKLSDLTECKFLTFPFISTQRDFGYSDATGTQHRKMDVTAMFDSSIQHIRTLKNVAAFYKKLPQHGNDAMDITELNSITIPTYVINLPERTDRRAHIEKQFAGRKEFDLMIVEACKHERGALGLWHSIRKIVQMAIDNDDDIIIICEDDHEFTPHYFKEYLLKNIISAYRDNATILLGGIGNFIHAIPVTKERIWINSFWSTQFVVLYREIFHRILDEPFDKYVTADDLLSAITSNKMVLHPFISFQQDFGYSDITPKDTSQTPLMFDACSERIASIKNILNKYSVNPGSSYECNHTGSRTGKSA